MTKKREETDIQRLERLLQGAEARMDVAETEAGKQTAARTVLMFASELRKARKEERRNADEITKADIVDAFRRMPDGEQGRLLRELEQQRKKGSGLA